MKYIIDNSIARYKACLVAYDFTQVYEIDYKETFTSTICNDALCIFFAIIAKNNWKIYQIDIVMVFLAEKLNKVIYFQVSYFL